MFTVTGGCSHENVLPIAQSLILFHNILDERENNSLLMWFREEGTPS